MSDKQLRDEIRRLAHQHPEFRKDLLPLVSPSRRAGVFDGPRAFSDGLLTAVTQLQRQYVGAVADALVHLLAKYGAKGFYTEKLGHVTNGPAGTTFTFRLIVDEIVGSVEGPWLESRVKMFQANADNPHAVAGMILAKSGYAKELR